MWWTTFFKSRIPSCWRVQIACSMASSTIEVAIVDATRAFVVDAYARRILGWASSPRGYLPNADLFVVNVACLAAQ